MSEDYPAVGVRVWGQYAAFTRPEMKVERVTYPTPTPSAARGILEAVFWKPQFTWRVTEIWVLNPIRYLSIARNEVNSRASERSALAWSKEGGGFVASQDRAQRHTLALRDVAYIIRAQVAVKPDVPEDPAKFRDQFRRRVAAGRCFATPYFGCREFAAAFAPPDGSERPVDVSEDLGLMLLDLDYVKDGDGRYRPQFFVARLEHGVLHVPSREERGGGGNATATAG